MKKNVLVFGLIAGILLAGFMVWNIHRCYNDPRHFEPSTVLGYASMLLIFSLIFVGVRNYRDKYNNGLITFGKAFKIGLLISLVASTMYVLAWLVYYYFFIPDFIDKYIDHVLHAVQQSGNNPQAIQKKSAEMQQFKELYKNPLFVIVTTYAEVLPIGIVISLISALILKRKRRQPLAG